MGVNIIHYHGNFIAEDVYHTALIGAKHLIPSKLRRSKRSKKSNHVSSAQEVVEPLKTFEEESSIHHVVCDDESKGSMETIIHYPLEAEENKIGQYTSSAQEVVEPLKVFEKESSIHHVVFEDESKDSTETVVHHPLEAAKISRRQRCKNKLRRCLSLKNIKPIELEQSQSTIQEIVLPIESKQSQSTGQEIVLPIEPEQPHSTIQEVVLPIKSEQSYSTIQDVVLSTESEQPHSPIREVALPIDPKQPQSLIQEVALPIAPKQSLPTIQEIIQPIETEQLDIDQYLKMAEEAIARLDTQQIAMDQYVSSIEEVPLPWEMSNESFIDLTISQEKKWTPSMYSLSIYSQDGLDEPVLTPQEREIKNLNAELYNKDLEIKRLNLQLETERQSSESVIKRLSLEVSQLRSETTSKSSELDTVLRELSEASQLRSDSTSDTVIHEAEISEISHRQRCRAKLRRCISSTQELIAPLKALHPNNRAEKGHTKQQTKESLYALENAPMFFQTVSFKATEEGEAPIFYCPRHGQDSCSCAPHASCAAAMKKQVPVPAQKEREIYSAEDYIGFIREFKEDFIGVTGYNPRTGVLDSSEDRPTTRRVRWASTEKGWNSKAYSSSSGISQCFNGAETSTTPFLAK